MVSRHFLEHVEVARRVNEGVLSPAFARRRGIPERTWNRWMQQYSPGRSVAPNVRVLVERPGPAARLRACLDSLDGAVLARRSALWALGRASRPMPLTVIVPETHRARDVLGVRVRRSRTLIQSDAIMVDGWPCTSPSRTLLDLAVVLKDDPVLAVLIDLVFNGQVKVAEVAARAEETPTAWGVGRVQRVLAGLSDRSPDSIFEWWVARVLREHGLEPSDGPRGVATPDGRFEVDLLLDGVSVECHGRHHFDDPAQAARDLAKANALPYAGLHPLAVDFPTFRRDPDAFARQVVRAVEHQRTKRAAST